MISKIFRFHGYGSLRYVYRKGKTVRGPMMSIKYAPNDRRKNYRLAVVVSRKVDKSAVKRNRIRRRIYEIVRKNQHKINKPHDIVVSVFSPQIAELPDKELSIMVLAQLHQAEII